MNREVIKELAEKAREAVATTRIISGQREMTWLPEAFEEKFFQLATELEREQCAKVCEEGVDTEHPTVKGHIMKAFGKSSLLAAAIRARGETK